MRRQTLIRTKSGDTLTCLESPQEILEKRGECMREERMLTLERPTIPAGETFVLDPESIESARRA